ncbi:amidohydrolase family protein [Actinomadura roseirufa]|uniref:amidohydrolase family protein n=1 Tax=Actinomadura roseirufa TaxID=2094049 RepID=UPI0010412D66|nr:amidohydrolase family protein [Actinomadura roseirufa]
MITTITNARVFDGERVLGETSVVVDGARIASVGAGAPARGEVVDAAGATLLPGLFDAHVRTSERGLALALRFGVTTELEAWGAFTRPNRAHVTADDALADVRSAGRAITPERGRPGEPSPPHARPGGHRGARPGGAGSVPELVASGSDYVTFVIEDGTVEGRPGPPVPDRAVLDRATLEAGVAQAHRRGVLTVAHARTLEATRMAVDAGVDGLAHPFLDGPHTPEIVDLIARSGAFVVPCVVLSAAMAGVTGAASAAVPRVGRRPGGRGRHPEGDVGDVLASVRALRAAGVDILAGTGASSPAPCAGGPAHGAGLHHELRYLVRAGLAPVEALSAATGVPARRFGLHDRGRVAAGLRADLLLVDGDPTARIRDTLAVRAVWRRGARVALEAPEGH